jgi:NADPH2:quinone reductase
VSASMRAMVIDRFGGPEVLREAELPRPEPGPGELLVRVACAGVNPADWKTREGWLSQFFQYRFPFVLGFDLAGTVVKVGEGVDAALVGRRVVAYSRQGHGEWGSYAEFAVVWVNAAVVLPDHVGDAEAASLPTAGITAWEALFESGQLQRGQRVLVHGGAGAVGSIAIQLAREAGTEVAATCSAANIGYVRELGAALAIDYRAGTLEADVKTWAPEGVDLVIDAVGQGSLPQAVMLTRRGGVIAPIATLIADESHDPQCAAERGVRIVPTMSNLQRSPAQLRELAARLSSGALKAPPLTILPLSKVAEAHRRVQAGGQRGKFVLQVSAS